MKKYLFNNFIITGIIMIVMVVTVYSQDPGGDLIWSTAVGFDIKSVSSVSDVNGDTYSDVFMGSGDNLAYCMSGEDGSIIWSWNTTMDVWSVATLSDVNDDNFNDCLAGTGNDTVYCFSGKPVSSGLTEIIWAMPTEETVWTVAAIGDLDEDGVNDCLAGTAGNKVYCFSGKDGHELWTYKDNSDILTVNSIPDVNGDNKDDCIAGGHGDRVLCISGGSSGTGHVIWYYKINKPKGASVLSVASIKDVNGDNVADCLAGGLHEMIYCLSGASQGEADVIWTFPTDGNIISVASIADVDEDGYSDCLAGGYDEKVYCISGNTGNKIWEYNTLATVYDVDSISDVNSDSIDDCIAGLADNSVHCIDGRTGKGLWIDDTPEGTVVCVTSISDVNSNGVSDVVAGSGDSYVYVYEGGEGITETVFIPDAPSGPSEVKVGTAAEFNTGGSESNLDHPVEYCFDWGDGSTSSWGDSSQNYTFLNVDTFKVKARARCTIHPDIMSDWSAAKTVTTTGHTLLISIEGSGTVTQDPNKSSYNHNETVSLTATPSSGYQFDQWGGDVSSSDSTVNCMMNADKEVTAYFSQITELEKVEMTQVPDHFYLYQNYPNPFNSGTCITFQLPQTSLVHLEIFNLSGDLIKKYPEGYYPTGTYKVYWNSTNQTEQSLPSGLYFYRLQAGNYYSVKSMIYLK